MSSASILGTLQHTIQQLHDVQLDLDVDAYIVDDDVRREIPGAKEGIPEQLFVRDNGMDDVEIALYIAPAIMDRLHKDNPHTRLHGGNLEDFCIALEGVSHFVFLAWRASVNWPVSALEMEIQAEVDKFVASWLLLHAQGQERKSTARPLMHQLFQSFELRGELSEEEQERYHTANRVARRYVRSLVQRYGGDSTEQRILRDTRDFYRQSLPDKLRAA